MSHVPKAMANAAAHCPALSATARAIAANMRIVAASRPISVLRILGCSGPVAWACLIVRSGNSSPGVETLPDRLMQSPKIADHGGFEIAERNAEKQQVKHSRSPPRRAGCV